MDAVRFLGLAAGMFAAVFLGMAWLSTVRPAVQVPLLQHADNDSPQPAQISTGDDDAARNRLRNEVLDDARSFGDDPCNPILRKRYIAAVNAYARAWISIAPCYGTHTCRGSDSPGLDRAAQAFGSPGDLRVRQAMQYVHKKATFHVGDFPDDTVNLVSILAADGLINPRSDVLFRQLVSNAHARTAQDCGH